MNTEASKKEKCYEIFWRMRSSKRAYCPQNSNYQNTVIKLIKFRKEHFNTIWNIKIAIKHFASFLNFEANLDFQSSCPKKFIILSTAVWMNSERIPSFGIFLPPLPYYPLSSCQIFLPLISTPTGFHDWGLVTRWAQLLSTSSNYLPSKSKDRSTTRAKLTGIIENRQLFKGN